jgi:glycosyltransferase involved in cell wall biosynthesis
MNTNRTPKILIVSLHFITFIKQDLEILNKHYKVMTYLYKSEKNAGKNLIKFLITHRKEYDLTYIWFADMHATITVILSKLLGKKCVVIAGGYDAKYLPEIGYGLLSNWKNRLYGRLHFGLADIVLVVDNSLKKDILRLGLSGKNIRVLPTGYDSVFWHMDGKKEKLSILTVSNASNITTAKVKGIDRIIKIARYLPDVKFKIIGLTPKLVDKLGIESSENISVYPFISQKDLLAHYQKASVYLQLSRSEGLPNALCEAMLCECVPVGTRVGGIPTAIGDVGYYVPEEDMKEAADTIIMALKDDESGKIARERIENIFPAQKREKNIVDLINKLSH